MACDFFVAFAFDVAQLHHASLFLRQAVDEAANQCKTVLVHRLFLRIGCVAAVRGVVLTFVQTLVLVLYPLDLVECQIAADGQAEGFYRVYIFPLVSPVPNLDHRFLNNIFRLRRVESDAEGKPIKLVFQR